MPSATEQRLKDWYPHDCESLNGFLHDAILQQIEFDRERNRLGLNFKIGYPRMEESAPKRVEIVFQGIEVFLATDVDGIDSSLKANASDFISRCNGAGIDCYEAYLKTCDELIFIYISGHPLWNETGWAQIRFSASVAAWSTEQGPTALPELHALAERQWDLWGNKTGPELSRE